MLITIVTIRPTTLVLARVTKFAAMRRRLGWAAAGSGSAASVGSPSALLARVMVRRSGPVALLLLIAGANDTATAGHPVTKHDRTFPPTTVSWQRCNPRPVTKLCPTPCTYAFVDRPPCHEQQPQIATWRDRGGRLCRGLPRSRPFEPSSGGSGDDLRPGTDANPIPGRAVWNPVDNHRSGRALRLRATGRRHDLHAQ